MENIDELWPSGPKYIQRAGVFRLGSDSVLLAAFARLGRVKTVLDLGCGGGIISVLLLAYKNEMQADGIEIDEKAVSVCEENILLNGLEGRLRVIKGDITEHRSLVTAGKYDLVVSNPPYFPAGSGYSSEKYSTAREEKSCTPAELAKAAAYAVRWGGSFCLVHRPERLSELCCCLSSCGLEPKRLRMVQHRAGEAPNLILLESIRGAKPGMLIEPSLIMTEPNGEESEEIKKIYRRG